MRYLVSLLLLGICVSAFGADQASFEPFTEAEKALYKFQLDKNFYPNETAWKAEMEKARQAASKLEAMKGKILASAKDLLATMNLQRELRDIDDLLWAYASFKKAINTDDRTAKEAQEKLDSDIQARTSFLKVELKNLTPELLKKYLAEEPGLKQYEYMLNDIVRMGPHMLTVEKESILSALTPDLILWQETVFQKMFDRHTFPKIKVGDKEFDIYVDFEGLLKNPDKAIREKTFKEFYGFFKQNADVVGLALRQLMKTLNNLAKMRGFETYYHQSLFERYLSRNQVDSLYKQIEEGLPLYHAYQQFRMDTLKKDIGIEEANFWDYDISPKSATEMRLTIASTTEILTNGLKVLGATYSYELGRLLDPKNGRLDIVPGKKREQGAFCNAYYAYYMDNYQGFLDDASTMAHESGHVIHYQLVKNLRGSPIFAEGSNYMTESFAMFNEWLTREYLFQTIKDPAIIANLRWFSVGEMMYLWELARRAKFEMVCYDRVAKDEITDEKGINKACSDVGNTYDLFFKKHPELEYHWIRKHHYWSVPTYYSNYVFAHILALKYLQMFRADPTGFPPKYIAMMSAGFDRPASQLLKDFLGIDFEDPGMLKGVIEMMQKNFDDLKTPKN